MVVATSLLGSVIVKPTMSFVRSQQIEQHLEHAVDEILDGTTGSNGNGRQPERVLR